jgi:hypothetical protein
VDAEVKSSSTLAPFLGVSANPYEITHSVILCYQIRLKLKTENNWNVYFLY